MTQEIDYVTGQSDVSWRDATVGAQWSKSGSLQQQLHDVFVFGPEDRDDTAAIIVGPMMAALRPVLMKYIASAEHFQNVMSPMVVFERLSELDTLFRRSIASIEEEPIWDQEIIRAQDLIRGQSASLPIPHRPYPPRALLGRLMGFAGLPRGWDGYYGEPIGDDTVVRSIEVLRDLYGRVADEGVPMQAPTVGPTPGGSIQLEWDLPHAFLAVEIPRRAEPLSFYLERADGTETGRDAASADDVWQAIRTVFGAEE